MPDYTIASQVKIPDSFATLGNMVNTARGITELQKSRATMEADITRAKAESSSAVTGAEKARQALPLEISRLQAESEKARTGADEAALALKARNENITLNLVNAVRTNPAFINGSREARTHILDSTEHFASAQGLKVTPGGGIDQMRKLIDGNATPEQITQAVDGYIQMLASPEAKSAAAITPTALVNTGQQLDPRPNLYQAPGAPLPLTIAPGERQQVQTNPVNNMPQTVSKDPSGNVTGVTATPTGNIPNMAPGDAQELPALTEHRTAARNAIAQAPDLHQNARGILEEIDKVSATGQAGQTFQKMNSALGGALDWSTGEKRASSYDLVGKYLERNALQVAQTMGPHTNSGLESVKAAQGSVAYNPTAIKKITKLVDANVTGTEAYQPGLEKAIAAAGPQGVLATRQYQQQWGQNYDPRMMLIFNATKSGDKETINDVVKSLGGVNSPAYKEFVQKTKNIEMLSQEGHL